MKQVKIVDDSAPVVSFTNNSIIEHVELSLVNVRKEITRKIGSGSRAHVITERHWDPVRIVPEIRLIFNNIR